MLGAVIKDKKRGPASIQKRSSVSKRQKVLRSVTVGGHIKLMALPFSTGERSKHIQRLEQSTLLNMVSFRTKKPTNKRCIKRDILDNSPPVKGSAKWRQTSLKDMWSCPKKRNSIPQIATKTEPFQISSHAKGHTNMQLPCSSSIRSASTIDKKVKRTQRKGKQHSKRASSNKFTGFFYSRPAPPPSQGLIPSIYGKTAHIQQLLRARGKCTPAFKMSRTQKTITGRNMATLVKEEGPPIMPKEEIKLSTLAKRGYDFHADSTTSNAQRDSILNGPPLFCSPKMEVIPKQNGQTAIKQDYLKRVYDKMSMDAAAVVDDIMGLGGVHRQVKKEEEDSKQSS
eukprot:scaffold32821_cov58-Attheya_sp.AAC.4